MMGAGHEETTEADDTYTGDDPAIHIDEVQGTLTAPLTSSDSLYYALKVNPLVLRQPWRVEPSEGPARVRRRLCEVLPLRPDAPLFSHPYRLWDDERRASITAEDLMRALRDTKVEEVSETSQVRLQSEEDVDPTAAADDLPIDTHEEEQVEVLLKDAPDTDPTQDVSDPSESTADGDPQVEGDGDGFTTRTANVSINSDGDISSDVPLDADPPLSAEVVSTSTSPHPSHTPALTVDTSRRQERLLSATDDGVASSPYALRPDASPLSATTPHSASSRPSSRARGTSFTGTSSDPIPAVDAEPKRRRPKAKGGQSPTQSSTPTTPSGTQLVDDDEARPLPGNSGGTLPLPSPLIPAMSAPVLSATSPANLGDAVNITVDVPPIEAEAPPPTDEAGQESFQSAGLRRPGHSRPRSLTAEDAAVNVLAPPVTAGLTGSSSSRALAGADKGPPSPMPLSQPMTPAVPVPGSLDDDEGVEGDELVFLEEEKGPSILIPSPHSALLTSTATSLTLSLSLSFVLCHTVRSGASSLSKQSGCQSRSLRCSRFALSPLCLCADQAHSGR